MRGARGFTLIELIIVICVVAVMFGVALERLLRYQEMAERAAMVQNLAAINTALTMKFAAHVTSGRPDAIRAELDRNPIELLARPPQNYLGELYAPRTDTLERASWYFDRQSHELIYLPNRRRFLSTDAGPPEKIRFRAILAESSASAPGQPRELPLPFVVPTDPFRWEIE
jgi:prepilin-type N-terminal cleavage/methylation domain-containing protein